jgi:hypothetical protein
MMCVISLLLGTVFALAGFVAAVALGREEREAWLAAMQEARR